MRFEDIQDISETQEEQQFARRSFADIEDAEGASSVNRQAIMSSPFLAGLLGVKVEEQQEEEDQQPVPQEGTEQVEEEPAEEISAPKESQETEEAGFQPDVRQVSVGGASPSVTPKPTEPEQEVVEEKGNGNIFDDMEGFLAKANHRVTYLGERIMMGNAEFFDFIRRFHNWQKQGGFFSEGVFDPSLGGENFTLPSIEVDGQRLDSQSIAEVLEDNYLTLKETVGGSGRMEKPEDTGDIFLGLLGENLGPSFGLAAIRKGISTASRQFDEVVTDTGQILSGKSRGATDDMTDFLRTEYKISLSGAATGGTAALAVEGDVERKQDVAELFNLAGMFGQPLVETFSTFRAAKNAYRHTKNNPLFNRDTSYKLTEESINRHLAKLVPEQRVKEIEARMRLVREVQKDFPGFQPNVGNLIGTEEARQIQRMVDTKNPDIADQKFFETQDAVREMTRRFTSDTDPANKAKLAAALSLYADETAAHLKTLRNRMMEKEEAIRRVSSPDYSGTETGEQLRQGLKEIQDMYRRIRDDLYKNIDPTGKVRLDPKVIEERIEGMLLGGDPLLRIREGQKGYEYFTRELPAILREMKQRSTLKGTAGVNTALGVTARELPHLTVNDAIGIYKHVGAQAAEIERKFPSSGTPRLMRGLQEDILAMMDNQIGSVSDPDVAKRFIEARKFMTDEYYSRFRQGAGGRLNERRVSGEYEVPLDRVGDQFWKAGSEVNIEDFNRIYREAAERVAPGDQEAAAVIREMAIDSLEEHAMKTLQKEIDSSTNTVTAIERWKRRYEGSLKGFPEVADAVDQRLMEAKVFEMDKDAFAAVEAQKNKDIIRRFTNADPDRMMDELFGMTSQEADQFLSDIITATKQTMANPQYMQLPGGLATGPGNVAINLDQALRHSFQRRVIAEAFDGENVKPQRLIELLNGKKKELIETVLLPEEVDNLKTFAEAIKLMGTQTKPLGKPDMNALRTTLQSFGISPASVLSRYYSASLGKVGPVYLITDAMTRALTGISSKHFDAIYRDTMYDLEGLERILQHMGKEESVGLVSDARSVFKRHLGDIKTKGADFVRTKLIDHLALLGYRVSAADKEEQTANTGQIVDSMLLANDDLTGQPSRIVSRIEVEAPEDLLGQVMQEREELERQVQQEQDAIPAEAMVPSDESPDAFARDTLPVATKVVEETGTSLLPETLVTLSALETGWGKKVKGNSYFGEKAHGRDVESIEFRTKEADEEGNLVPQDETFRAFSSFYDSALGIVDFLQSNPRFEAAFNETTVEGQLKAIAAAGYATDPNHEEKLLGTLPRVLAAKES